MFRNKNFTFLWFVNIFTTLAVELFNITILVTIYEQTESTLLTAGTMVARTLPSFLISPLAGVIVDRFSRKNILVFMNLLRVFIIVCVIWFLQNNSEISFWGFYLIIASLAVAGVFSKPASMALIPSLVTKTHLVKANSLIMTTSLIIMAVSFTIGGWLISAMQIKYISAIVCFLFVISILVTLPMKITSSKKTTQDNNKEGLWKSIILGWGYLNKHKIAKPLTIMEALEHLPHGIWTSAIMLAFTIKVLHGDISDWGYQVSGFFAGMIVGSIGSLSIISNLIRQYSGRIIIVNAFAVGLFTFAYAYSPNIWMAVTWSFLFGLPFAVRDIAQDSLLQSTVEEKQLGRVYATREMLGNAVFMFAGIFFAWLSDFISIRVIYTMGGVMYILTGFYALNNKVLRKSGMKDV